MPRSKHTSKKTLDSQADSQAARANAYVKNSVKKVRRTDSKKVAKREIKMYQSAKHSGFAIRKLPFQRLVREIAEETKSGLRFQKDALDAIQTATEGFAQQVFEGAEFVKNNQTKRLGIKKEDIFSAVNMNHKNHKMFFEWNKERMIPMVVKEQEYSPENLKKLTDQRDKLSELLERRKQQLAEISGKKKSTEEVKKGKKKLLDPEKKSRMEEI